MAEATPTGQTGTVSAPQTGTETAATAPVQQTIPGTEPKGGAAPPQRFEDRIRQDPDFALSEVQRLQSADSKKTQELGKWKTMQQYAEFLGQGDVKAGIELLQQRTEEYARLRSNPQSLRLVERALEGRLPDAQSWDEPEDEPDPRDVELRQLRERLSGLEAQTTRSTMESRLDTFFQSERGQVLTPDEKTELFDHLEVTMRRLGASEGGRAQLAGPNTIRVLVNEWLEEQGKLEEVSGRVLAQRSQQRPGQPTEGPPVVSSGVTEEAPQFTSAVEALRHARAKYGV